MKKLGRRGRLWLRGFHIFFTGAWIGALLSATIISFIAGSASDGSALHANYATVKLLDSIIVPSAVLTLITGLLLCWLTAWGFFKHGWVMHERGPVVHTERHVRVRLMRSRCGNVQTMQSQMNHFRPAGPRPSPIHHPGM